MRPIVRKLGVLTVASALAVLLVEVGLRLFGVSYPSFYTADEWRGTALRPGAEGLYRREGRAWVSINSAGLRDRERPRTKPDGHFRIALLGDSYTEARQVPLEQTFGAVLERGLTDCPRLGGRTVEAINFGVSGYGTTQELLTLEHHVWSYDPDLVILAFHAANDLRDNSRQLSATLDRPFHRLEGDELVLDLTFRDDPGYRRRTSPAWRRLATVINRSRLLQLVNEARNARRARIASAGISHATPAGAEPGLDRFIFREPEDRAERDAWRITEAVLSRVARDATGGGAGFLLVTIPSAVRVDPDPAARERLTRELGLSDLGYPDRRLAEVGRREGFSVLSLAPALLDHAGRSRVPVHGFGAGLGRGHWNEEGHRVAGEAIAAWVCGDRGEG